MPLRIGNSTLAENKQRRFLVYLPRSRIEPQRHFYFGIGLVIMRRFSKKTGLYTMSFGDVRIQVQRLLRSRDPVDLTAPVPKL